MSWREQIEPDWFHEAPFYLAALIAHGALLSINPVIKWGGMIAPEKAIPIEFVADIPLPPVVPPVMPPELNPGGDGSNAPPKHGPGKFEAEKVKQGAVDPPPKPKPSPKPAAVKSKVNKPGTTVHKAKAAAKPRPRAKPVVDAAAVKFVREAQAESKRLRAERDRAARAVVAEKAAASKAAAVELAAEKKRIAVERAAGRRATLRPAGGRARAPRRHRPRRAEAAPRRAQAAEASRRARRQKRRAAEAMRPRPPSAPSCLGPGHDGRSRRSARASRAGSSGRASARKAAPPRAVPSRQRRRRRRLGESESGDGGGKGEASSSARARSARPRPQSTDPGTRRSGGRTIDLATARITGGTFGRPRITPPRHRRRARWVATRNLDLTVTVRFQVLPNGSVKPGAVIQKTSGFPDIDTRALKALAHWRFQPVAAKSGAAEVWGRVTFRFTS